MEYTVNNQDETQEARKITIKLDADVEISISKNKFGELEIMKSNLGDGSSTINVMPHSSNVILIK